MPLHIAEGEPGETNMVSNSKQDWSVGATVKVGFLTLIVKAAVATPGDFTPDAYILVNAKGTQLYRFVPHNGVEKIDVAEAQAMVAEAKQHAIREAEKAINVAKQASDVADFLGMVDVDGEQFAHFGNVQI